MNSPDSPINLPPGVARKLREIEWRGSKLRLLAGLARTAATLITIMLAAMLLDFFVGWLNPGARYAVTTVALAAVAFLFLLWCAWPLLHRRSMVDTARNVDEKIPKLEERWSTVAEFAQNADSPEVRGSERMIREVASEADRAGAEINPETLVSREPLFRARRWLLGASALFGIFLLLNFSDARVLLHRFWAPGAAVSLTRLNATPVDVWVAKDEPLTLQATVGGRLPKEPPTLRIRGESGTLKEVTMSPTSDARGAFQHSIEELSDSFDYRVRAGDGETPWHRITAVARPEISAVRLTVTPPSYTHLPKQEKESLPNAIRVLQGSEMTVAFRSNQALDKMFLRLSETRSLPLVAGEDNWYYYRSVATEDFAFAAVALNKYRLENKNKPSSRISVYEDRPPTVKVVAPSDEIAVLPGEKVNITFEASDDFGLAKAEVMVATTKAGGETSSVTLPVDLEADAGKKQFRKSVMLDLKTLGLKHGDQLNYIVQVTDTKQTPAQSGAASPALANRTEQNAAGETKEQNSDRADASSLAQSPLEQEEKQAPANDEEQRAAADRSALSAKAEQPGNEPASRQSNSPPPNEMSKRLLDAGQSAACKPRNIAIDEWAGTFEGEKRRKLEIAIAPVLAQLAALLKNADEKTDQLKPAAASPTGLGSRDAESLSGAKADLGESEGAISSLKTRTSGTPYAFAGLQLHNIGAAHVTPSHDNLNRVAVDLPQAPTNVESISKASFHIERAREMLADLTRTFENVKRDQQVADAMQKLAKMHQLFIEDTQALLGNSPGPINSYNRKIAEVDEQFVAKLKELLEEKKKIMAELAKLLSEDPRLLRRYLAMQQLQCSSYRDQMTLLAERQKQFQQEITRWNAAPDEQRTKVLAELVQRHAADKKLIGAATALRENMETWLPLDVTADAPPVQAAFRQAEQILRLTVSETRSEAATAGGLLEEVRKLRTSIPQLDQIQSKDKPRMTAYIANRIAEVASLEEACARHLATMKSLRGGDFAKAAQITQHGITHETTVLGEKLAATEQQVARLSEEIAAKALLLNKTVQTDIVAPQRTTFDRFAERDVEGAGEVLKAVVPAFALAEQTFDELMRLIIAKLDEAPAPTAAGGAPDIEALLAMLQDEMKASEGLGIPCRPLNVAMMSDWMKPGMGQGMGQGAAQAQAAQAQSQQAKTDAERIEKQARASAEKAAAAALAEAKSSRPSAEDAPSARRAAAWNKLASSLQKDLLQGRNNTPPEEYREAIENYFKIISEATVPIEE